VVLNVIIALKIKTKSPLYLIKHQT